MFLKTSSSMTDNMVTIHTGIYALYPFKQAKENLMRETKSHHQCIGLALKKSNLADFGGEINNRFTLQRNT